MRCTLLVMALVVGTVCSIGQNSRRSQQTYAPQLPNATAEVYKKAGDVSLSLYIHQPKDHKPSDKTPAIVFFFGGGWASGSPEQFRKHCEYLATRGMVAIAADYRVGSRHGVKAAQCVADAKSAIRWIRSNAKRLGIDPKRIVAAGGSAGGHLAAATALVPGFDDPSDDKTVSAVPNALVLFNPALVLAAEGAKKGDTPDFRVSVERLGADPVELSPANYIGKGAPPAIIFHGRADTTVPYASAELFEVRMKNAGNRCELVGYDDQAHGFFNYKDGKGKFFEDTVIKMDQFLVSLGYLKGAPKLDALK